MGEGIIGDGKGREFARIASCVLRIAYIISRISYRVRQRRINISWYVVSGSLVNWLTG